MGIKELFSKVFSVSSIASESNQQGSDGAVVEKNDAKDHLQFADIVANGSQALSCDPESNASMDRATISKEHLCKMDNIIRDADFKRDDIPKWRPGHKLQKSGAVLIGTYSPFKPKYRVRFNIFVNDAFRAGEGNDDPWKLGSIDRDAFFAVADVYDHGDVVQFTLVEIDEECLDQSGVYVLDEEAKNEVRRSLIDSYFVPIPSFSNDPLYKDLMGNDAGKYRLDAFWEIDKSKYELGTAETSLDLDDSRIEVIHRLEQNGGSYCLFMELGEKRNGTPDIYRQIYLAKIEDGKLQILGIGQALMACLCDSFIENCHIREEMSDHILKITNKAQLASGNINLPKEGGKPKRIASWVRNPEGTIKVDYLEGFEQQKTEFIDFHELLLYLFILVAYPYSKREEAAKLERCKALKLDDEVEYDELRLLNGLVRMQSKNREDNSHPSLEYYESQLNAEMLLHNVLEKRAIESLYEGDIRPTYQMVKDAILENIWLNPFREVWFYSKIVDDEDEFTEAVNGMIVEEESPEKIKELEQFAEEMKAAFLGDILSSMNRIQSGYNRLLLPYRFTFSLSFDVELRQIRTNLFLPEPELLPSFTVKIGDPWKYSPMVLDLHSKRRKYAEFFAALCMLLITLIKSSAPWFESISLNAWIHRNDRWECVGAGEFPESNITKLTEEDQTRALARMKSLGLRFDKTKDNYLQQIEPCFELKSGMDFRFGFDILSDKGLVPAWLPVLKHDGSFKDLNIAVNRLKSFFNSDIKIDMPFGELKSVVESCYARAIAENACTTRLLSCNSDIEEELLDRDPEYAGSVFLERGLSWAFAIVGSNLLEMEDQEEAEKALSYAIELNPTDRLALNEMVALSVSKGDWECARSFLAQCAKYALNKETLAFVLRQYGFINIEEGDIETAKHLFICALSLDQSDKNVDYCMNELIGIGAIDLFTSGEIDVSASREIVSSAGYPLKLDDQVVGAAEKLLVKMNAGGYYMDTASAGTLLDLAEEQANGEKELMSREDLTKVFECVLGAKLGAISIFDYLFKPVVFTSREVCLPVLERLGYFDDAALLCVPYIDKKMGLSLSVVALVDTKDFEVKKALETHHRVAVKEYMSEYLMAYLRDYSDYPEIDLLGFAKGIMEENRPSEGVVRTRGIRAIDELRDLEMPDNVLVMLRGGDFAPEAMWAEAVDVVGEDVMVRLLSTPYDDFGINQGEMYPITLEAHPETGVPIAYIDCDRFT